VAKVAQSATATWQKTCQIIPEVELGTILKQFIFAGTKIKTEPNYKDDYRLFLPSTRFVLKPLLKTS